MSSKWRDVPMIETPERLDFRSVTRNPDRCLTTVTILFEDGDQRFEWIKCGESELMPTSGTAPHGLIWTFGAYLPVGVTDASHDAAWAFRMTLIGVTLQRVRRHDTVFTAWVDPQGRDAFRIPAPGYNPMKHPKTENCSECEGKSEEDSPMGRSHLVVPDGYYVPPKNESLFKSIRGLPVEIKVGPAPKEEKGA